MTWTANVRDSPHEKNSVVSLNSTIMNEWMNESAAPTHVREMALFGERFHFILPSVANLATFSLNLEVSQIVLATCTVKSD